MARSADDGSYVLPVSVVRQADGTLAETPQWLLIVSAAGYIPNDGGERLVCFEPVLCRELVCEPLPESNQAAIDAIFDEPVLRDGQISEVVELDASRSAVFRVTAHHEE